jgi:hypothetical protein
MNMDTDFEDDFDDVAGTQLSGAIPLEDAPALSSSAWYDLEDEPPDDNKVLAAAGLRAQTAAPRQTILRPAPIRQNSWSTQDTSSLPVAARSKAVQASSRWRNLLSLRSVLTLIALFAVAGGVAFAKGLTLPAMNSRPVVQQMRQVASPTTKPGPARATPKPRKAKPSPTPTPTAGNTPAVTVTPGAQALSAAWTASGRGTVDMLEALTVAETFTQRYETIDFRSPGTLSAARFILTQAANARFSANDERNTNQFAAQIQQERLIQAAFITGAQLVAAQAQNGNFFAWVTVSYQLARQQGQGSAPTMQNRQMTVLLIAVPFDTPPDAPPMGGIAWLVSNYSPGNALPNIPAQP